MPEPYLPNYEKWIEVFEQFKVDEETDLVGHSCGAGFLLRWLSENKINVGKLVLVAPWIDPINELGDENNFFDFERDHYSDLEGFRTLCLPSSIVHEKVGSIVKTVERITSL
ncbi:MAG: alpha/beta fold hydrolase [Candidatus Paceibacterota bacterium]